MRFADLGPPSPGVELRIARNGGPDVLDELQVGHLQIRGACVMLGYHDNPVANAECYPGDGWFDSGDLGFVCDGRLFLQLTHRRTMGGRLLSRFGGVEALAHAVLSSMNLPFFFGPQYRLRAAPAGAGGGGGGGGGGSGGGGFGGFGGSGFGAGGSDRYVDGSLSDSAPVRRDGTTIRVSPSDPTAHVRPPPGMLVGWGRFVVPGDREYLEMMDRQGFEDARRSHQLFVAGGWQERGT